MAFLIQSTFMYTKKSGEVVPMISYFQTHNVRIVAFNSMVSNPSEAKKYDTASEAHREKRKYFSGRDKVKVINETALNAAKL